MTTYQRISIKSDLFEAPKIPRRTLMYFRARFSNRMHALILKEFAKLEQSKKITRATLGKKIDRDPALITRWLGSPGNLTLDTVSDILLGMGLELSLGVESLADAKAKPVKIDVPAGAIATQGIAPNSAESRLREGK